MEPIAPLYLEDIAAGQTFHSRSVTVDLERMKAFATEFDPQPFHLDEEAAARSVFGGLVASGWYTASLAMRLLVDSAFKVAGGLVGAGIEEIRWTRPVRAGDVLRVESEVLGVRNSKSKPDRGIVRMRSTTLNQHGEPVMVQVANMVVPRRPASLAGPPPPGA